MYHTTQEPSWTILCMNPWGPYSSSTLEDHAMDKHFRTILHKNHPAPDNSWTLQDHTSMQEPPKTNRHKGPPGLCNAWTLQDHKMQEPLTKETCKGPLTSIQCKKPWGPCYTRTLGDNTTEDPLWTAQLKYSMQKTLWSCSAQIFYAKKLNHAMQEPWETIQQKIPCEQHNTNILEDHTTQVLLRTRPHKNLETKLCMNHGDQYYKRPYKDHWMQDP